MRYSFMDLTDHEFDPVAANRIRGGEQDIWTVGLNWYINNAIKAQLNYQFVDVNRLNAAGAATRPGRRPDIDALAVRVLNRRKNSIGEMS